MTEPLVSVVIPVYNGEEFVRESIESVLSQTYENFSLKIIDNCSTDATPYIADEYRRRDSRVTVLSQDLYVDAIENHNRAFLAVDADSEYVKVVQADDFMFPTCISTMVRLGSTYPSVGVISGYRLMGMQVDLVGLPYPQNFATGKAILRQSLLGGPYVTGAPSSLLFRSDLVRKRVPFYDAQFELCDTDAAYWAFTQADFALAHELLTFSRRQQKSRIAWTFAVGTTPAENLRMLLRYGPTVLSPDEFRRRVRYELAEYVKFHLKQRLRPSRWRQDDFHRFHRRMVRLIKEDSLGEREVVAAMNVVGALLNRSGEGGRPDARIEADRG